MLITCVNEKYIIEATNAIKATVWKLNTGTFRLTRWAQGSAPDGRSIREDLLKLKRYMVHNTKQLMCPAAEMKEMNISVKKCVCLGGSGEGRMPVGILTQRIVLVKRESLITLHMFNTISDQGL